MFNKMVVTGEGKTDMGICNNQSQVCSGVDYDIGPVTLLLVKLLEKHLPQWNADLLDFNHPESFVTFINRNWFNDQPKAKNRVRQSKKVRQGFAEHARRAEALAACRSNDREAESKQAFELPFYVHIGHRKPL